jgi:hypothetical protein
MFKQAAETGKIKPVAPAVVEKQSPMEALRQRYPGLPIEEAIERDNPGYVFDDTLKLIVRDMFQTSKNMVITGPAGSGKSLLLGLITKYVPVDNFAVMSTTASGAKVLNDNDPRIGAVTIHSFFRIPPDYPLMVVDREAIDKVAARMTSAVDYYIIDEVSMMNIDVAEVVFRGMLGKGRLILFGDVLQLPPIVKNDGLSDEIREDVEKLYHGNAFFFSAPTYSDMKFTAYSLRKVWRQTDQTFIELLGRTRYGKPTDEDLDRINEHAVPLETFKTFFTDDEVFLTLVGTNKRVEEINRDSLRKIPAPVYSFHTLSYNDDDRVQGTMETKVGATIMCTRNIYSVITGKRFLESENPDKEGYEDDEPTPICKPFHLFTLSDVCVDREIEQAYTHDETGNAIIQEFDLRRSASSKGDNKAFPYLYNGQTGKVVDIDRETLAVSAEFREEGSKGEAIIKPVVFYPVIHPVYSYVMHEEVLRRYSAKGNFLSESEAKELRITTPPVGNETSKRRKFKKTIAGYSFYYDFVTCYAITVHKSQGKTLDNVYWDSSSIFAPSQAYVALSRVRSFSNMGLSRPVSSRSFFVSSEARDWVRAIEQE